MIDLAGISETDLLDLSRIDARSALLNAVLCVLAAAPIVTTMAMGMLRTRDRIGGTVALVVALMTWVMPVAFLGFLTSSQPDFWVRLFDGWSAPWRLFFGLYAAASLFWLRLKQPALFGLLEFILGCCTLWVAEALDTSAASRLTAYAAAVYLVVEGAATFWTKLEPRLREQVRQVVGLR